MENHESAPASPEYMPPQSQAELDELLEQERMKGFMDCAKTANHYLNNQLGGPLLFSEMAVSSPDLPPNLHKLSQWSLEGVNAATNTLRKLLEVKRLVLIPGQSSVLDLEKSTQPEEPSNTPT